MNTRCPVILLLLYLSDIAANNTIISKLLPAYEFGMDLMVSEVSRTITAIESNRFGKASFIKIILPTAEDNTLMPQIMEKTAQKLGNNWLVTTNTAFCCNRYEPRTVDPKQPLVFEYTPDFYIIPIKRFHGLNYLDAQIKLMTEENSFNPRAIFLLFTLTHQCGGYKDNNNLTTLYFNQMWEMNCMSVVILVLSECDFKITIITANPFSGSNVCRKTQENGTSQYHSKWNEEEIDASIYKNDHKNFNKCQFSVGTIPAPPNVVGKLLVDSKANKTRYEFVGGIDLELLDLVSTIYNFTYVFDVHHGFDTEAMGRVLPKGSMVGILIDILQKNIDICVGGIIPNDYNFHRYEYSSHYKFSSYGWAVSDASLAPQWRIFFGAFSQDVWIISGFVFLITSFIFAFLDHFVKTCFVQNCNSIIETISLHCIFQALPLIHHFSISLGLSSTLQPKSSCLRLLYFSWSIYSLHMCIAYSSMLFLLISNPPLEKEIRTVEDLHDSGLKIGSKSLFFQRFNSVDLDKTTRSIMNKRFDCPEWESCIENLIKYRNFSILITKDAFEYYVDIEQSKVHTISEAFFSYGASVLVSKGNPLGPGFDKLVLLVLQSGLIQKWDRDTKSKFKSVNVTDGLRDSENKATVLTISDLKGTFFVLMSGIVISSLLLLGELMVRFIQRQSYDN